MTSFRGVDRRFDFKIKHDKVVFLSDYAHHPDVYKRQVISIADRKEAIRTACMLAQAKDVILVAGKGHENLSLIHIFKKTSEKLNM